MVNALFDTNILIDYLNGLKQARDELLLYEDKAISIITWMEVMVGAKKTLERKTRLFLEEFDLIALDKSVAELAAAIRLEKRIKLPEAIIEASARAHHLLLVTRNTKDFSEGSPAVRIPYFL